MKGLLLTYVLTLATILCLGQTSFTMKGQIKYCYEQLTDHVNNFTVSIVDIEPHYESGQEIQVNESGEFVFYDLKPSNYKLSTYLFTVSSIVVKVDRNISDLVLCIDNDFRPVPQDSLTDFIDKAQKDIKENNLKLYHLSPGLTMYRNSFYRRNRKLKRKFNFEIEVLGCWVVSDRQSYLVQQQHFAYNRVAEEYLNKKYGATWKQALK